MIFKKKEFFLLISLVLLQSCSGGKIGNFLESSFDNLENINIANEPQNVLTKKKVTKEEKKVERKSKNVLAKKNVIKEEKEVERKSKNVLAKQNVVSQVNQSKKIKNSNKKDNVFKRIKKETQSYKIIFILKDVDPKDPIKELSTILKNSEVNFEIEKIERFFDSKNTTIKSN